MCEIVIFLVATLKSGETEFNIFYLIYYIQNISTYKRYKKY